MKLFNCYLHYSDGLTKHLKLNEKDFEETFDIWKHEIDTEELTYLKIRVIS